MSWKPRLELTIEQAFEDIIPKINNRDWGRFATQGLKLSQHDVDTIRADHVHDVQRQKVVMLGLWRTRVGTYATVKHVYDTLNHFLFSETHPRPAYWDLMCQTSHDLTERNNIADVVASSNVAHRAPLQHPTQADKLSRDAIGEHLSYSEAYPLAATVAKSLVQPGQTLVDQINQEQFERLCQDVGALAVADCPEDKLRNMKNGPYNYPMKHHTRGYVLIFNNNFEGEKDWERTGSLKDVENLKKLWEKFGCKVVLKPDRKGQEMVDELRKFITSTKRSPCDYVCFFIMSHGGSKPMGAGAAGEYFYGSDRQEVNLNDMLRMLDNDFPATTLQRMPKLLFLQFCRGTALDSGVEADGVDTQTLSKLFPTLSKIPKNLQATSSAPVVTDTDNPNVLPQHSDLLISYATQLGIRALRDTAGPTEGSWFINAIVNTFKEFAAHEHVLDMMTKVNSAVSERTSHIRRTGERCKEMSEFRSLLTKNLFLLPGHTEDESEF